MKITKIGWVEKTGKLGKNICIVKEDCYIQILGVYTKGEKRNWSPSDWPPRKVRVIITDEEDDDRDSRPDPRIAEETECT